MTRAITFVTGCLLLGSCTQRMICPAYQSAFIYDKDELRRKFSYFQEDSTPKILTASKNKYLIAEPMTYQRKIRSMQTVQMRPVPVVVPDSLVNEDSVIMADLDRAARSVIDSAFIPEIPRDTIARAREDSVYVISKDKEVRVLKYNAPDSLIYDPVRERYIPQAPQYYVDEVRFNMEQDSYMWYLRDALVLPDVRLAKMQQQGGGRDGDKDARPAGKRQGGFFKNLFRKKADVPADTAETAPPPQEEFDFIEEADTVSQAEVPQPGQPQNGKAKKGLFGRKKKAEKTRPKKEEKPLNDQPKPAEKKKEDDDDGF